MSANLVLTLIKIPWKISPFFPFPKRAFPKARQKRRLELKRASRFIAPRSDKLQGCTTLHNHLGKLERVSANSEFLQRSIAFPPCLRITSSWEDNRKFRVARNIYDITDRYVVDSHFENGHDICSCLIFFKYSRVDSPKLFTRNLLYKACTE